MSRRQRDAARNANPQGRAYLTAIMARWREANRERYNEISRNSKHARKDMDVRILDEE